MSLADRPIIRKNLQFLVTNIILSIWIQDSKAQKKLLHQSNLFRFKIQDSRLRKNFVNPTSLDSKFKIQGWRPSDSRSFFGILNLESDPLGFKKSFWILNLESWILHLESWILPPWIQKVFLGSWILNLGSDVLREGWDGDKLATKNALSFRVQNVKKKHCKYH